jgi:DNA-binding FrmR family transcriptional regulator
MTTGGVMTREYEQALDRRIERIEAKVEGIPTIDTRLAAIENHVAEISRMLYKGNGQESISVRLQAVEHGLRRHDRAADARADATRIGAWKIAAAVISALLAAIGGGAVSLALFGGGS